MGYQFVNQEGDFVLAEPEQSTGLYLPLVNPAGVMGAITPTGHGDSKLSQDQFLLEPAGAEDLHSQAPARNFWCLTEGHGPWSVFGQSAEQEARRFSGHKDLSELEAGAFWQKVKRKCPDSGLAAEVLSFCPVDDSEAAGARAEVMKVTLKNEGSRELTVRPVAAVSLYGRGADHIRDHRHVTSLLNRMTVTADGIVLKPSMAFDERGHHQNEMSYGVFGRREDGARPDGFIPVSADFMGEGGSLLWPRALADEKMSDHEVWKKPGYSTEGYECAGVIRFEEMTLKPGASCSFYLVLSYMEEGKEYLEKEKAEAAFESMKRYWKKQKIAGCSTGNQTFDRWMQWVSLQPELRRIYGCSFLPHHDYGRGGRGWRDLWQDCLALILKNPAAVREDMAAFFAGIRPDGSNATIIGSGRGTFKADRNAIVRMWMDHGYWPYRTVRLYLDATGDVEFLFEKNTYFVDGVRTRAGGREKGSAGEEGREAYRGTLLEHLLVQHLTQFYDVGLHGHMRLRGADWNDALDMAGENGESVAFTAAYSGNLRELAELITWLREEKGVAAVEVAEELGTLLCADRELYDRPHGKQELLGAYCERCLHGFCGRTVTVDTGRLSGILDAMGAWIQQHIRLTETIKDGEDNLWFNGYYDNHGMQAEGVFQENVRMMLTSQVFSILSGTATDEQVERIVGAADRYLYEKSAGGYRLNTDFKEVKLDLGRMFGFAYGHKENGAVFCHMAVMYAYALYRRRFAREGYRVIESLYGQCMDFETSRLYPGIPEYFNERGRGMYPWLTGAGSWLILTLLTQIFGAEGEYGSLTLHPQLLAEQFDREGNARIAFSFAGRKMNLIYQNPKHLEVGDYEVVEICLDGRPLPFDKKNPVVSRETLLRLPGDPVHTLRVTLE